MRKIQIINLEAVIALENKVGKIRLALEKATGNLYSAKGTDKERVDVLAHSGVILQYLMGVIGRAKVGTLSNLEYNEVMSFDLPKWYNDMRQKGVLK